jgi:hypothetical protein
MPRPVLRWMVGLLTATIGCADDPGALDREVVGELTVTAGNAVGFQRSGVYRADLEVVECTGCDAILDLGGQGMCSIGGASTFIDQIEVLQTDGILLLEYRDLYSVGPLDADGMFAVGSVSDLSNALAELDVVLRIDGTFDDDVDARFTGLVRQRTRGSTAAGELLDCHEAYEIVAERL